MLKGKFLLFFLVLTGLTSVVFGTCTLDDPSCDVLSNSFNEFQIGQTNEDIVLEEVLFYKKGAPLNKIGLEETTENSFSQLSPLLDSGVYVLAMNVEDRAGNSLNNGNPEIKEYRFSNLRPLPPIVPVVLDFSSGDIQIKGSTHFPNQQIEYELEGSTRQVESDENGNFTIDESGLPNGVHKLTLAVRDPSNGLVSTQLNRVVYVGYDHDGILESIASVSSVENGVSISYQRQVFISGSASGGEYVLVNGVKTPVVNGEFGRFVNLNQGENVIEVGNQEVEVEFRNSRFHFLEVDFPKVISGNSFTISGEVSQPLPFDVIVNGEFIETISPTEDLTFISQEIQANKVKNFVSLVGYNGEVFSEVIYQDSQNPEIELLTPSLSENQKNLYVRVKDDIGLLSEQLKFEVSGEEKPYSRIADIYILNISELSEGTHTLEVSFEDFLSNPINQNLDFEINSSLTGIRSINNDQGNQILFGDTVYLREGSQQISLIPSEFIAFKSFRIDGEDVRNYEIRRNKYVEVNFNVSNEVGTLTMTYIDSNNVEYEKEFRYISDSEKPEVKFDYVQQPIRAQGEQVLLTGKIEDQNFDWNSFKVNGNSPRRYGENFEVYVGASNSLNIIGNDLSGNSLIPSTVSHLVQVENSLPQYTTTSQTSSFSFEGNFDSLEAQKIMKLSSYDGHLAHNSFLSIGDIMLPASQKEGIRSMNLKAISSGGEEFKILKSNTIDATPPTARLYTQNNELYHLIVDGTLSEVEINSILISANEVSYSDCDYKLSPHSKCLEFTIGDDEQLQLDLVDQAGNEISLSLGDSSAIPLTEFNQRESEIGVYFEGNDLFVNSANSFIQGNIFSQRAVDNVESSHGECEFDQISFVCMISLLPGENNVSVMVEDDLGNSQTENETVIRYEDFEVELSQVLGEKVYKVGDNYYYRGGDILVNGTLEREALLTLLVDGREIPSGMFQEGEFSISSNLDQDISGFDTKEITVQVKAEDDVGDVALSEKIKLTYNRVLDAIISVIVS